MIDRVRHPGRGQKGQLAVLELAATLFCTLAICRAEGQIPASLTLIPPSPVTDKIQVDIRGAVWNRSNRERDYRVAFYLDDEADERLIHKETLQIAPGDCRGVRFARSTEGQAGTHLWMDMEVFLFGRQGELYPRPIDGVIDDLARFPEFEKICCYSYTGLMNSPRQSCAPGGPATVKLYNDYRKFLAQGPPDRIVNHDAVGKKGELKSTLDPRYSKGNLTDGETAPGSYRSEQWLGFENKDFHAVIDPGQSTSIKTLRVGFLQDARGAIVLPRQVEFCLSENGEDYQTIAILKYQISTQESGSFVHLFEKNNINREARYVRVRAESVGQWLFVDEIIVNPVPNL